MEMQRFFLGNWLRHVIILKKVSGLMICNVLVLKALYMNVLKMI